MVPREVRVAHVFAWVLWTLAVVAAAVNLAFPNRGFGPITVLLVGAAATLHVHGFIERCAHGQREAFDLGRESVRNIR